MNRLWQILTVFGTASLLSFGGGNAVVPELRRQVVGQFGWLTASQFTDSFAVSQVAPGPSTLLVTLLGYGAAGLPGAVAATAAMVVPAGVLAWVVARSWLRSGHARWHVALEHGLAPVGVGLVLASGTVVAADVDGDLVSTVTTGLAATVLVATRAKPLAVVAAGGVAGLFWGWL